MPATPTLGTTTLTLPQAHTPSTIPTSKVAPIPIHSILQLAITATPLTISQPATSTLGTVKHTPYPEHTPTTTRSPAPHALTSTLYI